MKLNQQQGFTFMELMVVVGLFSIVSAFGLAMSLSSISRGSVVQERDLFVTLLLRGARAEAVANFDQTSHGVVIDNDNHQYILFKGETYDEDNTSNRVIKYTNEAINIENTGGETIIFEQLSGDVTTGAGTITIENGTSEQIIIINEVGQIDW